MYRRGGGNSVLGRDKSQVGKWGDREGRRRRSGCQLTQFVLGFKAVGPWIWVTDCLGQRL